MTTTDVKLLHYSFNLYYWQNGIDKENQVNQLINYLMNNFIFNYRRDFEGKYVILDFKDNSLSLIAYNILKNIQNICDIPLLIYGKHKLLRKYLKSLKKNQNKKKEKYISTFTLKRLIKKEQAIFVSCYNPIYQVVNTKENFNEFKNTYYLLKKMTPEQIEIIQDFYFLKDFNDINFEKLKCYNKFCNGKEKFGIEDFQLCYPKEIYIIKMTGNNEIDNESVNKAVDTDGLIFYECDKNYREYPILISEYQYYLKNKTNIPGYWNINTYSIVQDLIKLKIPVNYIGDVAKERWENEN